MDEARLAQFLKGGYSALPELDEQNSSSVFSDAPDPERLRELHESNMARFEMAEMILNVFTTPEGQRVLNYYKEATLNCVQFNPEVKNPTESGYFRAGEANIVLNIMRAMEAARKGPPSPPPELINPRNQGE